MPLLPPLSRLKPLTHALLWLLLVGCIAPVSLHAQIGGEGVFQVLRMSPSARVTALGGEQPAVIGRDLGFTYQNPALLNEAHEARISLNAVDYLADIGYGYFAYADSLKGLGRVQFGINYINYGDFTAADAFGNTTGNFSAGEYLLHAGKMVQLDSFRFGANLKLVFSSLENYNAGGMAVDLTAARTWNQDRVVASLLVRNLGTQLWSYAGVREPLPLDVQLAGSVKLARAPFRFGMVLHHLHQPELAADPPETDDGGAFGFTQQDDSPNFGDQVLQHIIFSTEILLSENFHLRGGYNFMRRQEMALDNAPGGIGFSWGLGFRINRFHVSYGRAAYHAATSLNHLSITTQLADWRNDAGATKPSAL